MVAWSLTLLGCTVAAVICACYGQRKIFLIETNQIRQYSVPNHWVSHGYDSWIVDCVYDDSYNQTGWGVLQCTVNPKIDPRTSAYLTGYAEGTLTRERISQHWNNTVGDYCQSSKNISQSCQKVYNFIQTNMEWMRTMIKKNQDDEYWKEVERVLLQLQGLIDGYHDLNRIDFSIRIQPFGLLLLQLAGDLAEIETALGITDTDRLSESVIGSGSCSGFIKVVADSSHRELYASHATWTQYNMMLRFVKRFNFADHTEVFSGYPGMLFSGDDFYVLSSGLVTMETTNDNFNDDLWKFVKPQSLLEWVRTIISNRHAKNGKDWCLTFQQHNSGTYNNQWMVADYNKFNSGSSDNILYILEQLPGEIQFSDKTDVLLNNSYWASYNVPYFSKIFNDSGMPDLAKKYGNYFSHDNNPRAKIFARDHEKVTDLNSVIKLMRYNDFKVDPLSRCNCTPPYSATNAVAARCDLNDPDGIYQNPVLKQRNHGATDVKATSSTLLKSLGIVAECGPTHDQQPIFEWSKSPYAKSPHEGHVDRFDFKPELFSWGK